MGNEAQTVAPVVTLSRVPVLPSRTTAGGQTDQVLSRGTLTLQKKSGEAVSPLDDGFGSLRRAMRVASADGPEHLERCVGEQIIQNPFLLSAAGTYLAKKLSESVGIQSHSIDVILELGSGKYPGLAYSLWHALRQVSAVQVKEDVKVICHAWSDEELSSVLRDARTLKVVIVVAARTPEISEKIDDWVVRIKKGVSSGADIVVKIISVVCMNDGEGERNIDGLRLVE